MPFALAIIGIIFMVTAVKGTTTQFFSLVVTDFTGSGNYIYWVISVLLIGSIGYVKKLQGISDMFLALILLVMFISNKGAFAQFTSAIQSGSSNCANTGANTASAMSGTTGTLFQNQANANPTATYQSGQSLEQQLDNMETNLNSAFGTSSMLGGG